MKPPKGQWRSTRRRRSTMVFTVLSRPTIWSDRGSLVNRVRPDQFFSGNFNDILLNIHGMLLSLFLKIHGYTLKQKKKLPVLFIAYKSRIYLCRKRKNKWNNMIAVKSWKACKTLISMADARVVAAAFGVADLENSHGTPFRRLLIWLM